MNSRTVTLCDAQMIASILAKHSLIKGVELFGSVQKNAVGNDLDLILIVSDECVNSFFLEARKYFSKERIRLGSSLTRRIAARRVLGKEFVLLLRQVRVLFPSLTVDLFLLPDDWKKRADEMESKMYHKNPGFISRIATYAARIA